MSKSLPSRLAAPVRLLSALALLALPACCVTGLGQTAVAAQAQSSPQTPIAGAPAQAQSPTPAPSSDPLAVDRDPVRSPDPEDNLPAHQEAPAVVGKAAPPIQQKGNAYTLRRDVEEVVLNATVLDNNGHLVNDLTRDDFHVWEDGTPQTVTSFIHQDLPVSMGILVDNSGSMRPKRAAVNAAALDLVRASNPEDEAFVVNFSDEAFLDQEFTSDVNKLREGLAHLDSKGGTALYDATVESADELARGAKRPKQVLMIITDGEDTASTLTLEQTIHRVQELQGPVVYTIGLLFGDDSGAHEQHRAKRALQLLSSETGGIAYFPRSLNDVDAIAAEVAHDIRSQYTIGYHSTKPAALGGYRVLKVEAHDNRTKKALLVRTRTGYYPNGDKSHTAVPAAAVPEERENNGTGSGPAGSP